MRWLLMEIPAEYVFFSLCVAYSVHSLERMAQVWERTVQQKATIVALADVFVKFVDKVPAHVFFPRAGAPRNADAPNVG